MCHSSMGVFNHPSLLIGSRRCGRHLPEGVPGAERAAPVGRAGEPAALQGAQPGPGRDQEGHR